MNKITLDTESYLVIGKENERFYPFLELEFNETVIYENDIKRKENILHLEYNVLLIFIEK